jgi:cell division protein FtsB
MIIRSNLASAPIKNYSLFLIGCAFLGVLVIVFTLWNLVSLSSSYSKSVKLRESIGNQQRQLQDLENRSGDLQTRIAKIKTPQFIAETEFMNNAIKRRTFSWTALFDHFEEVLPPSVKMISIVPSVSEESIAINLEMAGRSLGDMLELVRMLERDPQFGQVVLKGEQTGQDDQILFTITLNYIPAPAESTRFAASTPSVAEAIGPDSNVPGSPQSGARQ